MSWQVGERVGAAGEPSNPKAHTQASSRAVLKESLGFLLFSNVLPVHLLTSHRSPRKLFSTLNISSWGSYSSLTYFIDKDIKAHVLSPLPKGLRWPRSAQPSPRTHLLHHCNTQCLSFHLPPFLPVSLVHSSIHWYDVQQTFM